MLRFISSAMVGALICAGGALLDPDKDGPTWLIFPATGLILSVVCLVSVFLPLRAATRRFVPAATHRFQACVVGIFLLLLVCVLAVCLPEATISGNRPGFAAFWAAYSLALVATFFWPAERRGVRRASSCRSWFPD